MRAVILVLITSLSFQAFATSGITEEQRRNLDSFKCITNLEKDLASKTSKVREFKNYIIEAEYKISMISEALLAYEMVLNATDHVVLLNSLRQFPDRYKLTLAQIESMSKESPKQIIAEYYELLDEREYQQNAIPTYENILSKLECDEYRGEK